MKKQASAFGGVLIDGANRILLRRPKGDFDGYVWTFPKGRPNSGESPEAAALREVQEETGYRAVIVGRLPGTFPGGTSVTGFYLMRPVGAPVPHDDETSALTWATLDEAPSLIGQTTNEMGRRRDLSVLETVRKLIAPV